MRVGVDLTPLLPGGLNGGSKVLVLSLLREVPLIVPEWDWVLLTSDANHSELAFLDAPRIRRERVVSGPASHVSGPSIPSLKARLDAHLPRPLALRLKRTALSFRRRTNPSLARRLGLDVFFAPFTALFLADGNTPAVSVVYDLQHVFFPENFTRAERERRSLVLNDTVSRASRIVCISRYVSKKMAELVRLDPGTVVEIPISCEDRLQHSPPERRAKTLARHRLQERRYLLYPANFWPHKNHRALYEGFSLFLSRHPDSPLTLVCTGAAVARNDAESTHEVPGLGGRVVKPGFVEVEELADLLNGAAGLIFPSLYEGFGMPVLEALGAGVPVLCSGVTSLPEVAGDAAVFFEPRDPGAIADAIERLELMPAAEREDMVRRGRRHASSFGRPAAMAERYVSVLRGAVSRS